MLERTRICEKRLFSAPLALEHFTQVAPSGEKERIQVQSAMGIPDCATAIPGQSQQDPAVCPILGLLRMKPHEQIE